MMRSCGNFFRIPLSRRETAFLREPILVILDAYSCHKKLVDSGKLSAYNVFLVIVPN